MAGNERAAAVAAAEGTCPRCGAVRSAGDRYCLDCGLALPAVGGPLAAVRRGWIRRLGWYPGDWVWAALGALVVAAAGTAVAVSVSDRRSPPHRTVLQAPASVHVAAPATVSPRSSSRTATLPAPPEPGTKPAGNGRVTWPAHQSGWTVVLVSYPKLNGRDAARTAARAARGLSQVGVLDSSLFASLQPGYFVVFSGVYPSQDAAAAGVPTARQAGFRGAYTRQIG